MVGYDVISNRPKVAAYRAPGAPIAEYAVECVIDELADRLGMDPVELRLKNAAKEGTKAAYGPKFGPIGLVEDARGGEEPPALQGAARAESGPRHRVGLLVQHRRRDERDAQRQRGRHGVVMTGTPDIGGSRASMALMAAETLGIDYARYRARIGRRHRVDRLHAS